MALDEVVVKEYTDVFRFDYSYHNVPEHTRVSLENYFFYGYEPGSFVYSVLINDLTGACVHCDHVNREHMVEIVKWLLKTAPGRSWGNRDFVRDWIKDKDNCRTEFVTAWEKKEMWRVLNER